MDHFFHRYGGTEGQVYNLISKLDKDAFEVILCLFRYTSKYFETQRFPCETFALNINSFYSISSYIKLYKLRIFIKRSNIDIVQTFFNESALTIPIFATGTGAKIVSSRRDMGYWYTRNKKIVLQIISPLVDKYLVNSYAIRRNVEKKEKVPSHKVDVIYNGYDFTRFDVSKKEGFREENDIPRKSIIVGIVANLRPVKRVNDLILAFPEVLNKFPDAFLVSVGEPGDLLGEYKKLAERLGIQNNIRFIGNSKEVISIMKHFNVGVLCSESEGLSNVIVEYMSSDIPVVATKTGGNVELIENERTGLLVQVGDVRALSSAILRYLNNGSFGKKIAKSARQFVENRFDEYGVLRKYETALKRMVN